MQPSLKINPGATKWDIRRKVWDYMEDKNIANFPRPVHNRIPNFQGAAQAADRLPALAHFSMSRVVKVNPDRAQQQARFLTLATAAEVKVDPDKPLEGVRLAALQAGKTLLVPTPRLRTGLFNRIVPPTGASREDLRVCSTSQGVKEFSVPVGLEDRVKVNLVVVGSVAVSEKGYRIGKGEGYADMEYGMMVAMGAVSSDTAVVTVVHDCQVVDVPGELMEDHDLTVDYILTPTRLIKTECDRPKPRGIIWAKLDGDMLEKIPILKKLRLLEQEAGVDVTLKRAEPDTCGRGRTLTSLYVGPLHPHVRVSELKAALRERQATPITLTWQGGQHKAFLHYRHTQAAEAALVALQGLRISGHMVQVSFAHTQGGDQRQDKPKKP